MKSPTDTWRVADELSGAVEELREIARGIHPAPGRGRRSSSSFRCSPADRRPGLRCEGRCRKPAGRWGYQSAAELGWATAGATEPGYRLARRFR
jgi:hypothetical protein